MNLLITDAFYVAQQVGKLDNILLTFALIVTALICLSLFNINLQAYLVSAASIILATSFMVGRAMALLFVQRIRYNTSIATQIGNSAKNLFESIIYVFAMHPFDGKSKWRVVHLYSCYYVDALQSATRLNWTR